MKEGVRLSWLLLALSFVTEKGVYVGALYIGPKQHETQHISQQSTSLVEYLPKIKIRAFVLFSFFFNSKHVMMKIVILKK